MLTNSEKAQIQSCYEALRDGVDGFRTRRPQLEMIGAVARVMANALAPEDAVRNGRNIGIIEAGTGAGKSYGYLLPALVIAKSRGLHLVVSSSTIALQQQILAKDVPTLQRVLPFDFTVAVAKGRARYACLARLKDQAAEAAQGDLIAPQQDAAAPAEASKRARQRALVADLYERLSAGRWDGDRDHLDLPVQDEVWEQLITDRQGCAGKKCPDFARCLFFAARQAAREADLIVANHDLVLAALSMEQLTDQGGVLPSSAQTLFVFDEGHSLSSKAIQRFAVHHALLGAIDWVRDLPDVARDAVLGLTLDQTLYAQMIERADALTGFLRDLHGLIHRTGAFEERPVRRFVSGTLPDWVRVIGENILDAGKGVQAGLGQIREALLIKSATDAQLAQRVLTSLGFYLGRIENLVATWELMLAEDDPREPPISRWVERQIRPGGRSDFLVLASPIEAGATLRRLLWRRAAAVVVTSATLTSCGAFDLFLDQAGLRGLVELNLLRVASPFDYTNRARLVIPAMRSSPKDSANHTQEVIQRLPALANTLGTLVIFASATQMRQVYAEVPDALRKTILMQGALPKMKIVARHKAAIDAGQASIIFGLQSFGEGVDLPGEYCTHVVVAKLPFPVPTNPLEEARREWIEAQGRSAFLEITVPETGIRLAQIAGRLMRTDQDYGTVTVLDTRLANGRFAPLLLKGLPPFALEVAGRARAKPEFGGSAAN